MLVYQRVFKVVKYDQSSSGAKENLVFVPRSQKFRSKSPSPLGDQLPGVMNQGILQSGRVVKDVEGLKYGIQCMFTKFCGGDFNLSTSGLYFTSV
jgi:hypothetical protein